MSKSRAALAVAILSMLTAPLARAEDAKPTYEERVWTKLESLIAPNLHPLNLEDGKVSGPGAAFLVAEGDAAHIFMIGEQHATADIARLSLALFDELSAKGYKHQAMEIGPWSTAFAEDLMRASPEAFESYMSAGQTRLVLPFLFFREDADLAMAATRMNRKAPALWGLDQEFIMSAPIVLPILRERARTDQEKDALAKVDAMAAEKPDLIGSADPEVFAGLREAFEKRGDKRALELIDALALSNRVYAPFVGRGGSIYEANLERENYMKANFVAAFRKEKARSGKDPKVFLKFGAFHGSRGRSGTHVPALMDFLTEWSRADGRATFNLMIDCMGGKARDIMSGNEAPCESYFLSSDAPTASLLTGHVKPGELQVLDLRPLRTYAGIKGVLDPEVADLIYAYDALLIMPDVQPATLFGAASGDEN